MTIAKFIFELIKLEVDCCLWQNDLCELCNPTVHLLYSYFNFSNKNELIVHCRLQYFLQIFSKQTQDNIVECSVDCLDKVSLQFKLKVHEINDNMIV